MEVHQSEMSNEELRRYATLGVEAACEEHLKALQQAYSFFPELRKKHAKLLKGALLNGSGVQAAVDAATTSAVTPRKRKAMSVEARKRISEMMKKRWAERKGKRKVGRPRKHQQPTAAQAGG